MHCLTSETKVTKSNAFISVNILFYVYGYIIPNEPS